MSAPRAPKGTYDLLPDEAARRDAMVAVAAARLRGLRLPAHGHARVRGDRALRARRRRGHRHRAQGDVHVRRQGRALADPATRGYGAHLSRLRRARDAQAAAAGEGLVPLPDVPLRAPAGRSLPRALPDRRRGHRLGRSGGRCRGHRHAGGHLRGARRRGRDAQHEQHGRRRPAARTTSTSCAVICARERASSAAIAGSGSTSIRCAPSTARYRAAGPYSTRRRTSSTICARSVAGTSTRSSRS